MNLAERPRWLLAALGSVLFLTSSVMPLFGGAAKQAYRCSGRVFTGAYDDCFNDHLPIAEMILPLVALGFTWLFARFAFSMFAPPAEERTLRWRAASRSMAEVYFPQLHAFAALGLIWALWRGLSYSLALELWPFLLFWAVFACWFLFAGLVALPGRNGPDPA